MNQHQMTIEHINLFVSKLLSTDDEQIRRNYQHKVMGMLSLALALEIITIEEHEKYFDKIFNN